MDVMQDLQRPFRRGELVPDRCSSPDNHCFLLLSQKNALLEQNEILLYWYNTLTKYGFLEVASDYMALLDLEDADDTSDGGNGSARPQLTIRTR